MKLTYLTGVAGLVAVPPAHAALVDYVNLFIGTQGSVPGMSPVDLNRG